MRSYNDPCGVARALDAVGERWGLLVVRELLHGPKRFTALVAGLAGISQNVLSARLHELEQAGVVRRIRSGPPASSMVYELTRRGRELEPVLLALGRWGSQIPADTAGELSTDALILGLKTVFSAERARGLRARVRLRLGDDAFDAEISGGEFRVARGGTLPADTVLAGTVPADTVLAGDVAAVREVIFGGRPAAEAARAGDVTIDGDGQVIDRFARCFPRPATTR
jgi:DNA-binding HxlR family transcriptional regulator